MRCLWSVGFHLLQVFANVFESANSILHLEEFLGRRRFEALH